MRNTRVRTGGGGGGVLWDKKDRDIISIYKLDDVGISSLSLTNGHCPPPGRWIMKQWPA